MPGSAGHTLESASAKCPKFKSADDKKTCELAVAEVGKLGKKGKRADLEVFFAAIDNENGQLVLSRQRAKHTRTWSKILDAEDNDVVLEGTTRH
jgi:ribosomal protein S1